MPASWAKRSILVFPLALLAALPACRRHEAPGAALQIEMRTRPDPPVVGVVVVELELRNAAGNPVHDATVKVEGDMSHPGMVPSSADAREVAPGTYRADLDLTMAGDWIVLVDARLADGKVVRRTLGLPTVRGR
jgi:nitrogen fixation protein FixH